jgi:thiol-disulfide isomerase/thioredoxin
VNSIWVVVIVIVAATAFGIWNVRTQGRMRNVAPVQQPIVVEHAPDGEPEVDVAGDEFHGGLTSADLGADLGSTATLVQFSSAFCQPCRATRRTLDEVAQMVDGVHHVEIDAEAHLDLVRRLDILRTPTVLVLDRHGAIRKRASGQPRKADVIAALGELA